MNNALNGVSYLETNADVWSVDASSYALGLELCRWSYTR